MTVENRQSPSHVPTGGDTGRVNACVFRVIYVIAPGAARLRDCIDFPVDMSGLDGMWRAASFTGLVLSLPGLPGCTGGPGDADSALFPLVLSQLNDRQIA